MNWQVLAKTNFRITFLLLSLLGVFACEQSREIGFGLVPRDEVGVFFTDTLSIETSTVLGKVNTTNASFLLSGRYQDPDLGNIKAQSYFQLVPDTLLLNRFVETNELTYDSLVMVLSFTYLYGNTEASQTFALHELTQDLDTDTEYTNQSSVSYNPTPAYTFTVTGEQLRERPVRRIKISDVLGTQLFEDAKNNVTRANYLNTHKGYALVSQSNPSDDVFVIGMNTNGLSSNMLLYYTEATSPAITPRALGFFISTGARFNQISSDRSGTVLDSKLATLYDEVSISETDSISFIQSGVGIQSKISFPTLQNLGNQGNIAINRAELVLRVSPGSTDEFDEPAGIILYESNETNQVLQTIINEENIDLIVQQEGTNPFGFSAPLVLRYNERSEEYRADITTHLQLIYTGLKVNKSLLISPTDFSTRINRLMLNAKKSSSFSMKLRVFYTVFN
jgi:hypothetical protein